MASSQIVVIEDNPDFATILVTVFQLWGYSVEAHDTIAAGAAAIAAAKPLMVILDGQLPDGDGYDLYTHLRNDPATQQLPILLLSVSDDVHQLARGASHNDPHLYVGLKPIPLEDIQAIVERVAEAAA